MDTSLIDHFERISASASDKVAVRHNGESITFRDLRCRSRALGYLLACETGISSKRPIAVLLPKEINVVIADIAVLYAGCPFMDLDVKSPAERIAGTISLIRPAAVITDQEHASLIEGLDVKVISIDRVDLSAPIDDDVLDGIRASVIDTDPMCIINTSGSTGVPKGVVLNTRSFFDFMQWAEGEFAFDGSEVIGSLSPVVFDIFDFELTMLMMHGSQLVLLDAALASFPAKLLASLNDACVDFIFWVPTIMVNIANMDLLSHIDLPHLKLVWSAGEVFPIKQFCYWYDHLPNAHFVNLYGPIEITLDCTFYRVNGRPNESEPLPIGVPCRNTDVILLNDDNERCGIGEEGELCVRGTSLAMGYYNDPVKTAAAFVQHPLNTAYPETIYRTGDIACIGEDGLIRFKGRKDSMIKHMGYRIELDEIEHVAENKIKIVDHCCAVYRSDKKEIVLFYQSENEILDRDFRISLAAVLPSYMIPRTYARLKELPRNTNGKIDRELLKRAANDFADIAEGTAALKIARS